MGESEVEIRSKLMNLVRQRDEIESEIIRALDELKKLNMGMDEPLVDSEGYPRNDVDICAVRSLRQLIICKRNDCKDLTREIEQGLHALHSTADPGPVLNASRSSVRRKPFAKVHIVDTESPAEKANLRAGDLIVSFASITEENFQSLTSLSNVVAANVQRPIGVTVLRGNHTIPLTVVPEEWNGPGFLGCKIAPLNEDEK